LAIGGGIESDADTLGKVALGAVAAGVLAHGTLSNFSKRKELERRITDGEKVESKIKD
jgi:hydrogenase small subunit